MSKPDKAREEKLDRDGAKAGSESWGSHNPPHGVVETVVGDTAKCTRENAIYDAGFHNAREQKK